MPTDTPTPALEGAPVLPGYRFLRELGRGGMGLVYLARDERLERLVAIKQLRPDLPAEPKAVARFQREARLVASLRHPAIATVHALETASDGSLLLIMEYLDGHSLEHRLRAGALPPAEAIAVCRQIASALAAAHAANVIHRDLKPANVMLCADGAVKVLDFGLARALADEHSTATTATTYTLAGAVFGTPGYMSPEQARTHPTDQRADLFAFGCILYECLAGRRAFGGPTHADALAALLHVQPPPEALPASTPGPVRDLINACLVKDPAHRAVTAQQAADVLAAPAHARALIVDRARPMADRLARALGLIRPGEPFSACGACGYPVKDLPSFTCPECGSDLRSVGIVRGTLETIHTMISPAGAVPYAQPGPMPESFGAWHWVRWLLLYPFILSILFLPVADALVSSSTTSGVGRTMARGPYLLMAMAASILISMYVRLLVHRMPWTGAGRGLLMYGLLPCVPPLAASLVMPKGNSYPVMLLMMTLYLWPPAFAAVIVGRALWRGWRPNLTWYLRIPVSTRRVAWRWTWILLASAVVLDVLAWGATFWPGSWVYHDTAMSASAAAKDQPSSPLTVVIQDRVVERLTPGHEFRWPPDRSILVTINIRGRPGAALRLDPRSMTLSYASGGGGAPRTLPFQAGALERAILDQTGSAPIPQDAARPLEAVEGAVRSLAVQEPRDPVLLFMTIASAFAPPEFTAPQCTQPRTYRGWGLDVAGASTAALVTVLAGVVLLLWLLTSLRFMRHRPEPVPGL